MDIENLDPKSLERFRMKPPPEMDQLKLVLSVCTYSTVACLASISNVVPPVDIPLAAQLVGTRH
jgi:hypothetical protein